MGRVIIYKGGSTEERLAIITSFSYPYFYNIQKFNIHPFNGEKFTFLKPLRKI